MNHQISAEDVLPGHPDRVCDRIAETLVQAACNHDQQALVGVEVALHRHLLVVTGRVASGTVDNPLDISAESLDRLVAGALADAGYTNRWAHQVEVVSDLDVGPLTSEEREIRRFSDDQTIAVGYADPVGPQMLPIEHATARLVRHTLAELQATNEAVLGPDGKVLVTLIPGPRKPRLSHLNIAIQHAPAVEFDDLYRILAEPIRFALGQLSAWLEVPEFFTGSNLRINGIGDFTCGGPAGDNGLSGKKLVIDHYGPRIPIGGGALCGKDTHKPDRVGPLRARQLAVRLAQATGSVVTLHTGWLPGLEAPDRISAHLGDGRILDRVAIERLVPIPDLSLAGSVRDLELASVPWVRCIDSGYMGAGYAWG